MMKRGNLQVSLFPQKPFFPDGRDWGNLAQKLREGLDSFKNNETEMFVMKDEGSSLETPRIHLYSKNRIEKLIVSPLKIILTKDFDNEPNYKDINSYFLNIIELLEIDRWNRIGTILTIVENKAYDITEYLAPLFFNLETKDWTNFNFQFTHRNNPEVNQVVSIGKGKIIGENLTEENQLFLQIDVNNVPNTGRSYTSEELKAKYEKFMGLTSEENIQLLIGEISLNGVKDE